MVEKESNKFNRDFWLELGFRGIISFLVVSISYLITELTLFSFDLKDYLSQKNMPLRWQNFLISVLILIILFWILYGIFGNFYNLLIVWASISGIISWINFLKIKGRMEPLYPSDFKLIDQLGVLKDFVTFKQVAPVVIALIFIIGISYVVYRKSSPLIKPRVSKFTRWSIKIVSLAALFIAGVILVNFNTEGNFVRNIYNSKIAAWNKIHQLNNYRENGLLAGFLVNMPDQEISNIPNYSKESMMKIDKKYTDEADVINKTRPNKAIKNTNIVYVMSESFSDPNNLEGVTTKYDALKNTKKVQKENTSGKVLSAGYGGLTANIEYEALTGTPMFNFNNPLNIAYQDVVSQRSYYPSLLDSLDQKTYDKIAIHTHYPSFYKRPEAYKAMGFDKFISRNDIKHKQELEKSPYVSDKTAYRVAEEQLNKNPKKSKFIHLVTMQNHQVYDDGHFDVKNDDLKENQTASPSGSVYYRGIKYTDDDLPDFIKKVDKQPNRTIVVFWGDHLPGFYDQLTVDENGDRKTHETEMFIYDNKSHKVDKLGTTSPYFFGLQLKKMTGTKVTPYEAALTDLQKNINAADSGVFINKSNEQVPEDLLNEPTRASIQDVKTINYDLIDGKNYAKDMYEVH